MRCTKFITMCNERLPLGQQSPETACRPLILPLSFSCCVCMHRHVKETSSGADFLQKAPQCVGVALSATAHFRMDSSSTGKWRLAQGTGQEPVPEVEGRAALSFL